MQGRDKAGDPWIVVAMPREDFAAALQGTDVPRNVVRLQRGMIGRWLELLGGVDRRPRRPPSAP